MIDINQVMKSQTMSNCCNSSVWPMLSKQVPRVCMNCGKDIAPPQIIDEFSSQDQVVIDHILYTYEYGYSSTVEKGNTDQYNNSDSQTYHKVSWVKVVDASINDESETMYYYSSLLQIESLIEAWLPDQEFYQMEEANEEEDI